MAERKSADSIGEVIHKKEAKKLQAKGLSPIVLLDNRTIGKNSTQGIESQEENSHNAVVQENNRQESIARTRNQRKNFEIDEYLTQLLLEELVTEQFIPFYAKACHTLGLSKVNQIAVNARNGNNPQRLFAYKIKGAMQLHYKQEFERE